MTLSAMEILRRAQGQAEREAVPERRDVDGEPWWWGLVGFDTASSHSGESVTVASSMRLDAVYSCVRVLSDTVSALPLRSYRERGSEGGTVVDRSSRTARLIGERPNPSMTASDLWGLVVAHLNLHGNAFIGKARRDGLVDALWPIDPGTVQVKRLKDGRQEYLVSTGGGVKRYPAEDVIHVRGLSLDGIVGMSVVSHARHQVGAGLAMDRFQGSFFKHGATLRGVLKSQRRLSDAAIKRLGETFRAMFGGAANAHKTPVLEEGVDYQPVSLSLRDAEFVESQRLTAQKIARMFRVPPEMIGLDSGGSLTYSTVEGQGIHFERYSIRPWLVRIEQALAADPELFPAESRAGRSWCEFDTQHLLRADLKTRYEAYAIGLDPVKGWLEVDEVRAWERMPPQGAVAGVDAGRRRQLEMAGLAGIAAQRLGLGIKYGVLHQEEGREFIGLDGPPPDVQPDAGTPPATIDEEAANAA